MSKVQLITLIIAAVGGIPGIVLLLRIIFRTSIKIVFDERQTFICEIDSDNEAINTKPCFGFYALSLVGRGERPTTPKTIRFSIKLGRKWIDGERVAIRTHRISGADNCAILFNGRDALVLMGWINFIPSTSSLDYGSATTRSAVFFFDVDIAEMQKCRRISFVVEDFLGKKYTSKMKIGSNYYKYHEKNFKILDKEQVPSMIKKGTEEGSGQ